MFYYILDTLSPHVLFQAVCSLRRKQGFHPCFRLLPYCKWRRGIGCVMFHCSFLGQSFLLRPRAVSLCLAPCACGDLGLRVFEFFCRDPKDQLAHECLDDLEMLEVVVTLSFFSCCLGVCLLPCGGSSLRFLRLPLLIVRQSLPTNAGV